MISKVPATLHTPLMSGANSIHGIVLVGSMFIAIEAHDLVSQVLSLVAVAFATMNVVGGYVGYSTPETCWTTRMTWQE